MGDLPINLASHAWNAAAIRPAACARSPRPRPSSPAAGAPSVVGVVVDTNGSTYRKRGALILLDATGMRAGALSGGCLESEVEEHARNVIASGTRCDGALRHATAKKIACSDRASAAAAR